MEPASVDYAKGWGYEVTFPGDVEPVEVSEIDVEAEFARRVAAGELTERDADAERRAIAAEIARAKRDGRGRRRR